MGKVSLRPMSNQEFRAYLGPAVEAYAEERMRSESLGPEEARAQAEDSFKSLLPKGLDTDHQYLFTLHADGAQIGMLWFGLRGRGAGRHAYVYDILIYPAYQNRGYGSQTMAALEDEVRKLGLRRIALHVFGHNARARHVYEKLDYRVTNLWMMKDLE